MYFFRKRIKEIQALQALKEENQELNKINKKLRLYNSELNKRACIAEDKLGKMNKVNKELGRSLINYSKIPEYSSSLSDIKESNIEQIRDISDEFAILNLLAMNLYHQKEITSDQLSDIHKMILKRKEEFKEYLLFGKK